MERISRNELYLSIAFLISRRGTCERLQVGAVITRDNRIVATGYNGPLKDSKHCQEAGCNKDDACYRSIHAEANAIYFAARYGISLEGCTLYITHSPCLKCSEAIINSGIKEVVYSHNYRDSDPVYFLMQNNINCIQELLKEHEEKI